ncbi:MAG: DNA replication/repair protein RecF [Parasporobacterium sp.]|nr:DNA replication/repair protein RecF [Parasporobacterium sp.]
MRIKSLNLENYRNYDSFYAEFDEGVNIIYGENAQGKTNILESIYMCSTGKSHKGSKENEIIRNGQSEAHVLGEFVSELGNDRVDIHLRKAGSKGIALNHIALRKISLLFGKIPVIMFSSEDLDIIKRGPSVRRRFLDVELCQIDPIYVEDLINYNKIINQRKELLKTIDRNGEDPDLINTLDVWDLQLVKFGTDIIKRRRSFIDELNHTVGKIHSELTDGRENLRLIYKPSAEEDNFYEELLRKRKYDIFNKLTSVGPHRDDYEFFEKDTDLKIYGSNGQQRSAALSLKLSEIQIIKENTKKNPILLLDDVLSELDRNRQKHLLKAIKETQTIITCTGVDEFIETELGQTRKFRIHQGRIINEDI